MKTRKEGPDRGEVAARTAALVDDLNAVRSVVLNKQREISAEDYLNLERRLFESWVIEKLAEGQQEAAEARERAEGLMEELDAARKELKILQKSVAKLEKKLAK